MNFMRSKILFMLIFFSISTQRIIAQTNDSSSIAKSLVELANICKNVDFTDAKSMELGYFYKAAPYIVYRGDNANRKWKSACNYNNPSEKEQVDATCERINQSINQDSTFKIVEYMTEKESEGTWHVLMVQYLKKGTLKTTAFAFLKIGNKFLLGDID